MGIMVHTLKKILVGSLVIAISVSILEAPVDAAPLVVDPSDVISVDIILKNGKIKEIFCLGNVPGKLSSKAGATLFTAYSQVLKKQKQKLKKKPSVKNQKKVKSTRQIKKKGSQACKNVVPPTPTTTPTPEVSPPPDGNFDAVGNVTDEGKLLFGIPSELNANIEAGLIIQNAECGCHGERNNRTFSQLRTAILGEPMFIGESEVPDQDLADLTAYLNRFRR